jgi:hypothetical protein
MSTRKSSAGQQSFQLGDRTFIGIDTYTAPNRLLDGYFQSLQNMMVYGNALQPRNGWSTCWHSSTSTYNPGTGYPIYELTTLKSKGSRSKLLFSSFNGTTHGLYYYDTSTYGTLNNTYTELTDKRSGAVFSFPDSENVRMTQYGKYVYGVDGKNNMFRVKMNGQIPEAETIPILDDMTKYKPKATASPINLMPGNQLSRSYTTPIDTSGFSSAPYTLTNLIVNGTFSSATASGFGEWNYATSDLQRVTSVTKTVSSITYNVFAPNSTTSPYTANVKNVNNLILTRDGTGSQYCMKFDHIQDFMYQDIDVRANTVTYDEQPITFTAWNTDATVVVTLGNATISGVNTFAAGDRIAFKTSTVTNITAGTTYFVSATGLGSNSFQISATSGGASITPAGGTGGTFSVTLNAVITTTVNHNLVVGQAVKFSTVTGGPTLGTFYYVQSVPAANKLIVTSTSITVGATPFTFSAAVALNANTLNIQHNAGMYVLTFYAYNQDDLTNFVSNNTLDVYIRGYKNTATTAFSSSDMITGAEVYYSAQPATAQTSSDWQKFQILVDFREFDKLITGIQVKIASAFDRGGDSFVFVDDASLYAVNSALKIATVQDDSKNLLKFSASQSNTVFVTNTTPVNSFANYLQNEYIKINLSTAVTFTTTLGQPTITTASVHNLNVGDIVYFTNTFGGVVASTSYYVLTVPSSTTFTVTTNSSVTGSPYLFSASLIATANYFTQKFDLRTTQSISIRANLSSKLDQSVPPFSLGIRTDNTTEFTGQCRYDKSLGYLTFELFPITAAARSAVSTLYVKFDFDLVDLYDNEWVLSLGEIAKQGALTPQTKYAYAFTLWTPSTLPTSGSSPYWGSVNFTASNGSSTITTSAAHKLGVGSKLTFTGTTGGVVTATTYYVLNVLTTTTFTVTTDASLTSAAFSFTAGVTSAANQFTPTPDLPSGDGLETGMTGYSTDVVITEAVNKVSLELATTDLRITSTSSGQYYKYANVYRRNLLTGDNVARLIGIVDLDTGLAYSDGTKWEGFTSSISGTTVTVIDQVPDTHLLFDNGPGIRGYRGRVGRDQFPAGCDCIGVYNMRLFASKRNTIYCSWLLNANNEYGIYTTLISDATDPEVAIKGAAFTLSNQLDQDQVMAMISIQGDGLMRDNSTSAAFAIMKENAIYLLTGDNPQNFANQGFLQTSGSGLIAKRGYAMLMGQLILTSPNGIMELKTTSLVPKGQQLEGVLNPRSQDYNNGTSSYGYISPAAYADVVMCVHDRKLVVLAPTSSDTGTTTNSVVYVFDSRIGVPDPRAAAQGIDMRSGGWVNWTNPTGVKFTAIVAVDTSDDTQDLYTGSRAGKLYKLDKHVDQVYSSADPTTRTTSPISWSIKTRKYGQSYAESNIYYSANKIHSLNLHIDNQDTTSLALSWSITGQKGYSTTGNFSFPANTDKILSIRSISRTADQQTFDIQLTGTSIGKWKLYGVHALTTEGNTPRS